MRPVLSLVVHEFRTRWRAWAVLVLLVAVAGGAVLAAAAGARRTSSAYPRYLHASHASDLLVSVAGTGLTGYYGALARQPGVALVAPAVGLNVQPVTRAGRLDLARPRQHRQTAGSAARWTSPGCWPGGCPGRAARARSRWTRLPRPACTCMSAARCP